MARKYRLPLAISKSFTRGISLVAQGKQVSPDHLFRYNTGRFIVNEDYELAKRFSPFDLDGLCKIVSSVPSVASPIRRVEKKEGGYNKALLMTAENGRTVIAKVPCRNIVPRQYGTASEVAVLRFGMSNASLINAIHLTQNSQEAFVHTSLRSPGLERRREQPCPDRVYRAGKVERTTII